MGNLLSKTDRKDQTITYAYDNLDRLTSKTYPDSTAVDYTYDNLSRLTQATDPTGTYSFTYDRMSRLTGTTTNYSFLTGHALTMSYSYDAASNRIGMTDPQGGVTQYVYDTLNRLTTLTDFNSDRFTFAYDALGRRTALTRPNGVNTSYSYDALSRLLSVLHQGGVTLDSTTYTYDAAGNRTSKVSLPSGTASSFTYDAIYQLTQVAQGPITAESYSYDAVGNRLSSLGLSPYQYNSSNELTSTPSATYTYDANGNTLSKTDATGTTTYAWDFENRLTSVTLPGTGGTVSFKYDPFGRRIQKSSASGTTDYVYDGDNVIEELDSGGNLQARYTQGLGIDEPLATLRSGATSYYHADGLGSVTSLSNTAGALANSYTYDSFGNLTASTGSVVNPLRFTAREFDTETNLYFYRARYYDPTAGRFLGEDPVRFRGGNNFYRYAKNSPLIYIDPSGLEPTGLGCHCFYYQTTGAIYCVDLGDENIVLSGTGYSGHANGFNNPAMQDIHDTGPIPVGEYALGPKPTARKGRLTIPLTPLPGTDTHGRSGFLIHGDNRGQNHSASTGCIVLGNPDSREVIGQCRGGTLTVLP